MKIKILLVFPMMIFYCSLTAQNQKMANLYKYAIENFYNESIKEGYLSKRDTRYLLWCFGDYADNCFNYDVQLHNDKMQFKMPTVSENSTSNPVYKLNIPELKNQFVQILISYYMVSYMGKNESIWVTYSGTTTYMFEYDKDKSEYIFRSKEVYGL
jgi:hypothetical protein